MSECGKKFDEGKVRVDLLPSSNQNLINILIFAACAVVSALLFLTTLNKELKIIEERQWKTK